jgi:type II secretory pathway pseudopilin PulG
MLQTVFSSASVRFRYFRLFRHLSAAFDLMLLAIVYGKAATMKSTHHNARAARRREQGYIMVAVLAAMTITLITIAATLPSLKHNMQREREAEMFYRAEQIVTALAQYQSDPSHPGQLPTSLEQLTEYNPISKRRYLRESALKDPMTSKGDWKLVRMGDPVLKELAQAYLKTMKLQGAQQLPPILAQALAVTPGTLSLDGDSGSDQNSGKENDLKPGADTGPFVGVVSRSKEKMIRNYLGIETYDKCAIITGVPSPNQLFIPGMPLLGAGATAPTKPSDPRCPKGGFPFEVDGRTVCTGVLYDGRCPPGSTDPSCSRTNVPPKK